MNTENLACSSSCGDLEFCLGTTVGCCLVLLVLQSKPLVPTLQWQQGKLLIPCGLLYWVFLGFGSDVETSRYLGKFLNLSVHQITAN